MVDTTQLQQARAAAAELARLQQAAAALPELERQAALEAQADQARQNAAAWVTRLAGSAPGYQDDLASGGERLISALRELSAALDVWLALARRTRDLYELARNIAHARWEATGHTLDGGNFIERKDTLSYEAEGILAEFDLSSDLVLPVPGDIDLAELILVLAQVRVPTTGGASLASLPDPVPHDAARLEQAQAAQAARSSGPIEGGVQRLLDIANQSAKTGA